jgi:photosystem II stability/assembly factor-like uncharacterized protein
VGGRSVSKLTNSGNTVTRADIVTNTNFRDVYFTDAANGWVVGDNGQIYVSTDSGTTWTSQTSGVSIILLGVHFTSQTDGWAVGQGVSGTGPTIRRTTDGGTNWTAVSVGTTIGFGFGDVLFLPSGKGWVVGGNGKIYTYNSTPSNVEPILSKDISVYPNPFDNLANISFPENGIYNIQVVDMTGRLIYTAQVSDQNLQLNTSSWAAGMYRLNISNEKGQFQSKTIVKE